GSVTMQVLKALFAALILFMIESATLATGKASPETVPQVKSGTLTSSMPKPLTTLKIESDAVINHISFSADGKSLAVELVKRMGRAGIRSNELVIWDLTQAKR